MRRESNLLSEVCFFPNRIFILNKKNGKFYLVQFVEVILTSLTTYDHLETPMVRQENYIPNYVKLNKVVKSR